MPSIYMWDVMERIHFLHCWNHCGCCSFGSCLDLGGCCLCDFWGSCAHPHPVCSGVQPGACQWGTIYEGQLRALHIPLGQLWNCKASAHSGYVHPQISIDLEISVGLLMTAALRPDPSGCCRPAGALLLPAQPSGVNGAGSVLLLPTTTRGLSRKHGREGVFLPAKCCLSSAMTTIGVNSSFGE